MPRGWPGFTVKASRRRSRLSPAQEHQAERAGRLMADALRESARAELDDPFAQLTGPLASTTRLDFEVVDTVRRLDAAARLLTLDIVLHGDGPGERWVRSARPGDRIEGIGPRGKITTSPAADWHLFIADEAALPATFVMTESLAADSSATLILEVPEED